MLCDQKGHLFLAYGLESNPFLDVKKECGPLYISQHDSFNLLTRVGHIVHTSNQRMIGDVTDIRFEKKM